MAGAPGIPGIAGGLGAASAGNINCVPRTSMPCTILIPRSFTAIAGVVGAMGTPGMPGIPGGVSCGAGTPGGVRMIRASIFTWSSNMVFALAGLMITEETVP